MNITLFCYVAKISEFREDILNPISG